MSEIGGFTLYIRSGALLRYGIVVQTLSKPGTDGYAYRDMGQRSRASFVRTMADFNSDVIANTVINDYKLLQGSLVTVIDEMDVTFLNVMVLQVDAFRTPQTGTAVGGFGSVDTGRTIVEATWVLRVNE